MRKDSTMRRLTMVALVLGTITPVALAAQSAGGGGSPPREPARILMRRPMDAALARELAAHEAERARLVARVESLVAQLHAPDLPAGERPKLQGDLEAAVRQLTTLHTRLGLDVGTRVVMRSKAPSVATDEVRRTLNEAQRRLGQATRMGYVGVTLSATDNHVRAMDDGIFVRYNGLPTILTVEPQSPAERAGLRSGDTLLAYDGRDVRTELPMHEILRPGRRVTLSVQRDGAVRRVPIEVAAAPAIVMGRREEFLMPGQTYEAHVITRSRAPGAASAVTVLPSAPTGAPGATAEGGVMRFRMTLPVGVAGASMMPVTPGLANAIGVKSGVLVLNVAPGSQAAASGLRDGDVVVTVEGLAADHVGVLTRAMREHETEKAVMLGVVRERRARTVRLTW